MRKNRAKALAVWPAILKKTKVGGIEPAACGGISKAEYIFAEGVSGSALAAGFPVRTEG